MQDNLRDIDLGSGTFGMEISGEDIFGNRAYGVRRVWEVAPTL